MRTKWTLLSFLPKPPRRPVSAGIKETSPRTIIDFFPVKQALFPDLFCLSHYGTQQFLSFCCLGGKGGCSFSLMKAAYVTKEPYPYGSTRVRQISTLPLASEERLLNSDHTLDTWCFQSFGRRRPGDRDWLGVTYGFESSQCLDQRLHYQWSVCLLSALMARLSISGCCICIIVSGNFPFYSWLQLLA